MNLHQNKIKSLQLFLLMVIMLISCTIYENEQEPVIRVNHKGPITMKCKINGDFFIARKKWEINKHFPLSQESDYLKLLSVGNECIRITKYEPRVLGSISIGINDFHLTEKKTYAISPPNYAVIQTLAQGDLTYYHTDSLHTGQVKITKIDEKKRIIKGEFSFDAVSFLHVNYKAITITEGVFEFKY